MQLIDNGSQAASPDVKPSVSGTPGYFTNGSPGVTPPTVVDAYLLNTIVRELVALVTQMGGSLDRTNDEQIAGLITPHIKAIVGAASTTGPATTQNKRAVIASTIGLATGENSVVMASEGDALVSAGAVGRNSAVIASLKDDATVAVGIHGEQTAAVACENVDIASGLSNTAAIASEDCYLEGSGSTKAVVASLRGKVAGGGSRSFVAACSDSEIHAGGNVALVGSANARVGSRNNGLALGWSGSAPGAGSGDANLTIWLSAEDGEGNATAWNTGGADYAEWFRCEGPIEAGTPVTLDGEIVRPAMPGDWLLGVISDNAGVVGNQDGINKRGDGWCIVGLLGQIRVRTGANLPVNTMIWQGRVRVMGSVEADGRQLCFVR